jgi:endonuclease/exonuclease/phosphatase family metal-dependent hydrolase
MAAKSQNHKSLFRRIVKVLFILLNIVAVLLLAGSYAAPYISPQTNAWLPFLGLAYPILVIVNLFFVVIWIFFNWRWAFLSLITILAGWMQIVNHIQYSKQHSFMENEFPVSVMSYNVRNFDMYNYKKDWSYTFDKRNKIFDYLRNEKADIICFQEFVNDLSGEFKTIDTLVSFLEAKNVHAEYTLTAKEIIQFGIATFTKYPIVGKGRIDFENSKHNLCIFTDVLIGEDTVRIYNAHFESIRFSKTDYEYANDVAGTGDLDRHTKSSKRIVSLLKAAFLDRSTQAEKVAEHIRSCPYPVILCTDLNDTPASYAYRQLSKLLEDAFKESGTGMGTTYAGIFPSFRIDYILHSDDFTAYNFTTKDLDYSDHNPVTCDLVKSAD